MPLVTQTKLARCRRETQREGGTEGGARASEKYNLPTYVVTQPHLPLLTLCEVDTYILFGSVLSPQLPA